MNENQMHFRYVYFKSGNCEKYIKLRFHLHRHS